MDQPINILVKQKKWILKTLYIFLRESQQIINETAGKNTDKNMIQFWTLNFKEFFTLKFFGQI